MLDRLDISYLADDLFLLSTVIFAFIGWIITIVSLIVSSIRNLEPPYYSWWICVYQFFIIFCVITIILSNSGNTYRVALIGLITVALSCETLLCNTLVYDSEPSQRAIASGYIFLSIVNVIWILYYGTTNDSIFHSWTNSYISESDKNIQKHYVSKVPSNKEIVPNNGNFTESYSNENYIATAYMTHNLHSLNSINNTESSGMVHNEYSHKAKAIYSYNASPDDPREISFVKDEILEISDISGKWWQARKEDGTIGIVPSNYVRLIIND